nr:ABC transporter substrate-binding protein [Aeromicrobium senzhongii]
MGAAATLALSTLAACGGSGSDDDSSEEIIIGNPMPLTGAAAGYGVPQSKGAQIVVDAINEAGGIKELGGRKLKLVTKDTKSDPATTGKIIRELEREGAVALAGPSPSAEVIANKALITKIKIPTIISSIDPSITADTQGKNIFRAVSVSATATEAAVDMIKAKVADGSLKDLDKVGILTISTVPGPQVASVFKKGLEGLGIETTEIDYDPAQVKDFAPTVAKLKSQDVDMVVGYQYLNDQALFAQAIDAQSWRPKDGFLFTQAPVATDSFRRASGDVAEGWMASAYTAAMNSDVFTPEVNKLAADFQAEYKDSAEGNAVIGMTVVTQIANALAEAKSTDPDKLTKALRAVKFDAPKDSPYPFYGFLGGMDYDESGENQGLVVPIARINKELGLDVVWPQEYESEGQIKMVR